MMLLAHPRLCEDPEELVVAVAHALDVPAELVRSARADWQARFTYAGSMSAWARTAWENYDAIVLAGWPVPGRVAKLTGSVVCAALPHIPVFWYEAGVFAPVERIVERWPEDWKASWEVT